MIDPFYTEPMNSKKSSSSRNKSPKRAINRKAHPLVGLFFLSFTASGQSQWQGRVEKVLDNELLLVQLFSWVDGRATNLQLIRIADTVSHHEKGVEWKFYSDHAEWIEAANNAIDSTRQRIREQRSEGVTSGS